MSYFWLIFDWYLTDFWLIFDSVCFGTFFSAQFYNCFFTGFFLNHLSSFISLQKFQHTKSKIYFHFMLKTLLSRSLCKFFCWVWTGSIWPLCGGFSAPPPIELLLANNLKPLLVKLWAKAINLCKEFALKLHVPTYNLWHVKDIFFSRKISNGLTNHFVVKLFKF